MDKRGDNGSPCLSPRVTSKNSDNSSITKLDSRFNMLIHGFYGGYFTANATLKLIYTIMHFD